VAIDALYTLSGRNLLAVKLIAVAALRFQIHRRAITLGMDVPVILGILSIG
jgi:hypothetical protein